MPIDQLLIGLGALAGIFIVFGLAGLVLSPVVPLILALGIAIGLLGLGLLGAGIGTLAFVTALIALAAVGATIGPVIVAIVGSILQLIPIAMAELGKGIVAFAAVIGDAMPVFLDAFVKLITTLLTAIDIIFPRLMATLWMVIVGLVSLLVRAIPLFVDAGMKMIVGILKGIGDNIYQLVTAAADVIVNFLNGIANNLGRIIDAGVNLVVKFLEGIGRNVQKVTDAAADLIIDFVNGLASTIETKSQAMREAGGRLAGAIVDGMTGGLASKAKEVADGAWKMGQDALAAIAGAIDSNSPSKETHKLGTYFGDGFIGGISAMNTGVSRSAGAMGTNAVDTLKKTISDINNVVPDNVEMTPSIRPVLDLSAIKKDSRLINGMIKSPSLTVDTSYSRAASISASTRANGEEDAQTKTGAVPDSGTNLTFNQYNNSPKALSRAEIYRQTRNQISTAKGALT
jgi:phage-related protein